MRRGILAAGPIRPRSHDPLDIRSLREDFPILRRKVQGKPLVYLDSSATAQKPRAVVQALERFYLTESSNIHRGVHELSLRATEDYERARVRVQQFIGAADEREIVFTRGTTESINLVARSLGDQRIGRGDEILITEMEHHSNIVPWQLLCERTGAVLRVAPVDDGGELLIDEFEKMLSSATKLVAVTHVSNALGTCNPVERIVELAHSAGALVLIDGAQGIVHERFDIQRLGCDFYAFSGHKLYGPTGIGVLYGKLDVLDAMPPFLGGGDMIRSVTFEKTTYNDVPHKFEAGTPDIGGAIGLGAAVGYLQRIGMDRITASEQTVLTYGVGVLEGLPRVQLVGKAGRRSGVVSFNVEGVHPHDVGTILDQEGIAVRAGHHCAQPLMERMGVSATVRASIGCYTLSEEFDALAAGIRKVIEVFD
jgi:cysteine desulfurase/selenocysteine lyase